MALDCHQQCSHNRSLPRSQHAAHRTSSDGLRQGFVVQWDQLQSCALRVVPTHVTTLTSATGAARRPAGCCAAAGSSLQHRPQQRQAPDGANSATKSGGTPILRQPVQVVFLSSATLLTGTATRRATPLSCSTPGALHTNQTKPPRVPLSHQPTRATKADGLTPPRHTAKRLYHPHPPPCTLSRRQR